MANSIIIDKLRESRHNTNLGGINITSLNIGRKRPIFCREVKPGDKGTLSISGNYILNPLVATNVGKVHVKTEAYFVPACDNMVGFEDMLLGKPVYKNGVAVNPHVPRVNAYNWVNQFFLNCNYNTSLRCYDLNLNGVNVGNIGNPPSLVNVDVQEQVNALGTRDFDKNSSTYFKNVSYSSVNPTNEIIGYLPFNVATRLARGVLSISDVITRFADYFYIPYWYFLDDVDAPQLSFTSLSHVNSLGVNYSLLYDFITLHMSGRHGEEFMLLDNFQIFSPRFEQSAVDSDILLDSFYVPIVRLTAFGKDILNLTNAFKWIQTYNPLYLFNHSDFLHSTLVESSVPNSLEPTTRSATASGTSCIFSDLFGYVVNYALSNNNTTQQWVLNNLCKRSDLYAQGFDYFLEESVPSAIANICVNSSDVYFLDINAFVDNICSSSPLNNSLLSPISDAKFLFNLPDVEWRRYADLYEYNFEGMCGKLLFDFTYVVSLLPLAAHCSLFYTHTLPKVWKNLFYRLYSMLSHDGTYDDAVYLHLLQVLLPLSFVTRYDDNFLTEVWATPTSPDGEVVSSSLTSGNGVLNYTQSNNGENSDFPAYGVDTPISNDNSRFRDQLVESVSNFLGVSNLNSASFDQNPLSSGLASVGDSYNGSVLDSANHPHSYSSLLALKLARHLRSFALKNNVNSFSKIAALCERFGLKYETHDLFESSLIYSNETEIEVQKIASTTETNQISLGDIAGHGESYDNGKKVSFRADRFGYVIVYLSVTPVGTLYEGRNKEMAHIDMLDFYSPQTDALTMTPVSSSEVRARYEDSYMPVKLGSSVFGFAPYGYEYKIGNNVLSGDFLIRSAGKYTQDSYHLLRTLGAGASFNGNGTFSPTANNPFNYSYLVQNPFFNLSFDAQQFNRIFQSTDSLLDKIYFFGRVDFNLSRQGRPLFDLSLDENATESIN